MQFLDVVSLGRLVVSWPELDTLSWRQLGTHVLLSVAKLQADIEPQHLALALLDISGSTPVTVRLRYLQEVVEITVRPNSLDARPAKPLSMFLAAGTVTSPARVRRRSCSGLFSAWRQVRTCFVGGLDCRAMGAALRPVVEMAAGSMSFDDLFSLLVLVAAVLADPNGYGSHEWGIEDMGDGAADRGSAILSVRRTPGP